MKRIKLEICTGTSCHLMGAHDLVQAVEALKPSFKEHLEITFVPCLGECKEGPNVRFNGQIFTKVTPEQLKKMVIQVIQE